jgi:hypothetical protein
MGFMVLVMIVLAILVSIRARKPVAQKIMEESKSEKIFVEKGFEDNIKEDYIEKYKEEEYTPVLDELPVTQTEELGVKIEYTPVEIDEPLVQEMKKSPSEVIETEQIQESEPILKESTFEEPDYTPPEETIEIITVEPIILEASEIEESAKPDIDDSPRIPEYNEDVIITPNLTFYEPIIEEPTETKIPSIDNSPALMDETPDEEEINDIKDIELSPLESDESEQILEEIKSEIMEEPELEPVVVVSERPSRRIRKPVIDESDPDLQIDLGVETCPHCRSMVPATIYCINCGKALDPADNLEIEKEKNG